MSKQNYTLTSPLRVFREAYVGRRRTPTYASRQANNESSEIIDILLQVTYYFNPSTRLDNVKNLWRFVIIPRQSCSENWAILQYASGEKR